MWVVKACPHLEEVIIVEAMAIVVVEVDVAAVVEVVRIFGQEIKL
jgi:hypothetical protein